EGAGGAGHAGARAIHERQKRGGDRDGTKGGGSLRGRAEGGVGGDAKELPGGEAAGDENWTVSPRSTVFETRNAEREGKIQVSNPKREIRRGVFRVSRFFRVSAFGFRI